MYLSLAQLLLSVYIYIYIYIYPLDRLNKNSLFLFNTLLNNNTLILVFNVGGVDIEKLAAVAYYSYDMLDTGPTVTILCPGQGLVTRRYYWKPEVAQ